MRCWSANSPHCGDYLAISTRVKSLHCSLYTHTMSYANYISINLDTATDCQPVQLPIYLCFGLLLFFFFFLENSNFSSKKKKKGYWSPSTCSMPRIVLLALFSTLPQNNPARQVRFLPIFYRLGKWSRMTRSDLPGDGARKGQSREGDQVRFQVPQSFHHDVPLEI